MSAQAPPADTGSERDVDLAAWRRAIVARWWIVLAGVIVGAMLGGVMSLSGGHLYRASALLAPGQPLSPGGQPVLTYQASPLTIDNIVKSEAALREAAAAAHMSVGELRGHVSTTTVETGVGSSASRAAVLIKITAQLDRAKRAEVAANTLADIVKRETNSIYVTRHIATYQSRVKNYTNQIAVLGPLIESFTRTLKTQHLAPLDQLVVVSQLDSAVARQGNLSDRLATTQDQLILAQNIEIAQVVTPAVAARTTARSRRTSITIGAIAGLLVGMAVAIFVDSRRRSAQTA
jgi:capsular polysaccharide biosynthesis protein